MNPAAYGQAIAALLERQPAKHSERRHRAARKVAEWCARRGPADMLIGRYDTAGDRLLLLAATVGDYAAIWDAYRAARVLRNAEKCAALRAELAHDAEVEKLEAAHPKRSIWDNFHWGVSFIHRF